MAEKTDLICEGGGTKAAYTCRVLQCSLDHDIEFSHTAGIGTGVETLLPFVAKQKGRPRVTEVDAAHELGAIGVPPLIHEKGVLGIGCIRGFIKKHASPDCETFMNNKTLPDISVYNMDTNEVEYFPKEYSDPEEQILMQANYALFLLTRLHKFHGRAYVDAGLVDMIPTEQSVRQGNTEHVFISTKKENYVRKPAPGWQIQLAKLMYPGNKTIRKNLEVRHISYQKQWQTVGELEGQGSATVLRPSADYGATHYTYDRELLGRWFDLGYEDTKNRLDMIRELMEKQADYSVFFVCFH